VKTVVVAAAVIERDGCFLLTKRSQGAHLGGLWEFPGGKCEPGESIAACLARELLEELGTDASVGDAILTTTYRYGDRQIELHFLRCRLASEPASRLGQEMRWVERAQLSTMELPPADAELIRLLTGSLDQPPRQTAGP
jgi:mutator protein MutT